MQSSPGLVTPIHPLVGAPAWLGFSSHLIPPTGWVALAPGLCRDARHQQPNLESLLALVLDWVGLWEGQVFSGCGASWSHPHTLSVCPAGSVASAPLPTHFRLHLDPWGVARGRVTHGEWPRGGWRPWGLARGGVARGGWHSKNNGQMRNPFFWSSYTLGWLPAVSFTA